MKRNYVNSSNVRSVGYANGVLEVEFHGGGIYPYVGVPESVFDAFMTSSSKGQFVHQHVKNRYPTNKIC